MPKPWLKAVQQLALSTAHVPDHRLAVKAWSHVVYLLNFRCGWGSEGTDGNFNQAEDDLVVPTDT